MKSLGKKFEDDIKKACIEQGIDYTRLRDAGWRCEETERRFTIKNICDCILYFGGVILFAEMKHRKQSLRFDEITQLDDLKKKWNPGAGVFSGVFCMLNGDIYFLSYQNIIDMRAELGKKSFNGNDALHYGLVVKMFVPNGKRAQRPDVQAIMRSLMSGRNDDINFRLAANG